jgi:hypothetical protein
VRIGEGMVPPFYSSERSRGRGGRGGGTGSGGGGRHECHGAQWGVFQRGRDESAAPAHLPWLDGERGMGAGARGTPGKGEKAPGGRQPTRPR